METFFQIENWITGIPKNKPPKKLFENVYKLILGDKKDKLIDFSNLLLLTHPVNLK